MLVRIAVACLLAAACAAQAATPPGAMGYEDARHLLLRTGFAPTDAQVRQYAWMTREAGVDRLLREGRTTTVTSTPGFAVETTPLRYPRAEDTTPEERRVFLQTQVRQGLELRAWWMQEMLVTPSPLTERMTLFWHNHFVSSQQKVRFARLMYGQNAMLRANALGNFGTLLHAASKDPAMLVYLDGAQSRKAQPNENFAREVMELFTLGEGNYGEQDIKEAARAFTGWSINRDNGTYVFRPALHDNGIKTVLGRSGNFDGDGVLDVLLARPETSRFVTAKLWREFVSPEPDAREVERIAQIFRGRDYDIKAALRALFLSEGFWSDANRGTLVKSPVELVVGTLRQLEVESTISLPYAVAASGMGQNLFSPPNVKGWPGGEAWINSNTLLARKQFLDRIARNDDARATQPGPGAAGGDATMAMMGSEASSAGAATNPAPRTVRIEASDDAFVEIRIPRQAVASPAGATDEDRQRVQRFNRAIDRALRNVGFNGARWVGQQPGATPVAKMQSARTLLLVMPPAVAEPATVDSDPQAFVRATLLDPVYQLK